MASPLVRFALHIPRRSNQARKRGAHVERQTNSFRCGRQHLRVRIAEDAHRIGWLAVGDVQLRPGILGAAASNGAELSGA